MVELIKKDSITSFEVHDYPPNVIIGCGELIDKNCNSYNVFYFLKSGKIYTSYNYWNLVLYKKDISLSHNLVSKYRNVHYTWIFDNETTFCKNIFRLEAFQRVCGSGKKEKMLRPPRYNTNSNEQELIDLVAENFIKSCYDYYARYKGLNHIILMGGLDSRLIFLALYPILNRSRCRIASADPEYEDIKKFLEANNSPVELDLIKFNKDSIPLETDIEEKMILSTGALTDCSHMRQYYIDYYRQRCLENKTCLWYGDQANTFNTSFLYGHRFDTGIIGDSSLKNKITKLTIELFLKFQYHSNRHKHFYYLVTNRAPHWQGLNGSAWNCLFNARYITPYGHPLMLETYLNHNFSVIEKDIRLEIADAIGKKHGISFNLWAPPKYYDEYKYGPPASKTHLNPLDFLCKKIGELKHSQKR